MLALRRNDKQTIVLTTRDGRRIEIKVLGGTVKLAIDAPQDVRVLRGELENKERAV